VIAGGSYNYHFTLKRQQSAISPLFEVMCVFGKFPQRYCLQVNSPLEISSLVRDITALTQAAGPSQ
jgi:hypothetical protein